MADSKMLVTACDDMLSHLYDVQHGSLIDAFSGASRVVCMCTYMQFAYTLESVFASSCPYDTS